MWRVCLAGDDVVVVVVVVGGWIGLAGRAAETSITIIVIGGGARAWMEDGEREDEWETCKTDGWMDGWMERRLGRMRPLTAGGDGAGEYLSRPDQEADQALQIRSKEKRKRNDAESLRIAAQHRRPRQTTKIRGVLIPARAPPDEFLIIIN
jgi:hypothetical protein